MEFTDSELIAIFLIKQHHFKRNEAIFFFFRKNLANYINPKNDEDSSWFGWISNVLGSTEPPLMNFEDTRKILLTLGWVDTF